MNAIVFDTEFGTVHNRNDIEIFFYDYARIT